MDRRDIDTLLSRKETWTGAAVQDLVPGSQVYGHYFRVSLSNRDPQTGDWEIRWTIQDEILKPSGEPVYVFDGSTWDMPAQPLSVFPWSAVSATLGSFVILAAFWLACAAPSERGTVIGLLAASTVIVFLFIWWASIEPTRGTKVGAGLIALLVARRIQMHHTLAAHEQDMGDRFTSGPMAQALEQGRQEYFGNTVDLNDLERRNDWRR